MRLCNKRKINVQFLVYLLLLLSLKLGPQQPNKSRIILTHTNLSAISDSKKVSKDLGHARLALN